MHRLETIAAAMIRSVLNADRKVASYKDVQYINHSNNDVRSTGFSYEPFSRIFDIFSYGNPTNTKSYLFQDRPLFAA
jgi:hypothetical protein